MNKEKKCQISPLYGKDNNNTLHFYCEFCEKKMGYHENRVCKAKREKCPNCGKDIGMSDLYVSTCLNCNNKLTPLNNKYEKRNKM